MTYFEDQLDSFFPPLAVALFFFGRKDAFFRSSGKHSFFFSRRDLFPAASILKDPPWFPREEELFLRRSREFIFLLKVRILTFSGVEWDIIMFPFPSDVPSSLRRISSLFPLVRERGRPSPFPLQRARYEALIKLPVVLFLS